VGAHGNQTRNTTANRLLGFYVVGGGLMEAGAVPGLDLGRTRYLGPAVQALQRAPILEHGEVPAYRPNGDIETLCQLFDGGLAGLAENFQQQFLAPQAA